MFFMMGIMDKRKELEFVQTILCDVCGKYGRYEVFMTYTVLSLFLIPCFKWNRHFYVRTTCCNTLYELSPEIGNAIVAGESVEILPKHLIRLNQGGGTYSYRTCRNCGYETGEDFEFCPKCGQRF